MTTPTGQIRFSDVTAEFGTPPTTNLGSYRVNQSVAGRNWPLDTGVPTPGNPISFSQLRGKTLNVVVDYNGSTEYGVNSQIVYDSSGVVIGGFKSRPTSTSSTTKKVYHVVRKTIGSRSTIESISPTVFGTPRGTVTGTSTSPVLSASGGSGTGCTVQVTQYVGYVLSYLGGRANSIRSTPISYSTITLVSGGINYSIGDQLSVSYNGRFNQTYSFSVTSGLPTGVSLQTGSWNNVVLLSYIIANGGVVSGSGGKGGEGSGGNGCGLGAGGSGGDAMGVQYNCTVILETGGLLAGGGGGGGGGGFTYSGGSGDGRFHGGGGGGGAGLPPGGGGVAGYQCVDPPRNNNFGLPGSSGTTSSGGSGGAGANWGDGGIPRKGGNGGNLGLAGDHGNPLSGSGPTPDSGFSLAGANGGPSGAAIIRNNGITVSVVNNGGVYAGSITKIGTF